MEKLQNKINEYLKYNLEVKTMLLAKRNSNDWMTNLFNEFFDDKLMPHFTQTAPAVNVSENENEYRMEIAVPGLKKEFCRVSLNDEGNLEVKMENKVEHKDEDKKRHYLHQEFHYSNYEQCYVLPDNVEKDKISAKVSDGVLYVDIPKMTHEEIKDKDNKQKIEVH